MKQPKIVLVTDWITRMGGGEKVVEQFHQMYPEAPIYTSYCHPSWQKRLHGKVVTGYLQHWPFSVLRRFLPVLRQAWFSRLDFSGFDTIISISGNGEAKFVRTTDQQTHICYCHTPPHFYWAQYNEYVAHPTMRPYWLVRLGLRLLVRPLRANDYAAAQKIDHFIANSTAIQHDIKTYYERESTVIFPPIDCDQFMQLLPRDTKRSIPEKPRCLWWGRIVPAKKIDVIIQACNELEWPLTIVGDGPALPQLKALAGPTITFTGYTDDKTRDKHIVASDLFLFPSKEDFGVTPVEVLAAGVPVVAYKAGGAIDYIQPNKNGVFFDEQTVSSLIQTLRTVPEMVFDAAVISESARTFSSSRFRTAVQSFIEQHTGGNRA